MELLKVFKDKQALKSIKGEDTNLGQEEVGGVRMTEHPTPRPP